MLDAARAPLLRPNAPPPPHYYAANVARLLRAVEAQYSDLLSRTERDYLQRVLALPVEALRLYARLLTRKGPLIRIDSLQYRELSNLDAAVADLMCAGLVRLNPAVPADRLLALLTCAELATTFPHAQVRGIRKQGCIASIAARYPESAARARIVARHPVCEPLGLDTLATMQILFFGDTRAELTTFVLEDLGMLRFEQYPLDSRQRQFRDRAELDDYLSMRLARAEYRDLEAHWSHDRAVALIDALWCARERRFLERVRSNIVNGIGRCAERARDYDTALSAYARSTRAPSRERAARLLRRLGDVDRTDAILDAIDAAPSTAGERFFGQRFRTGARRPLRPIAEEVLRLPAPPTGRVEIAALEALTATGGCGRHLENRMPLGMLGLSMWDVVFAPVEAAFVHPYQDRPADLYWDDFRHARAPLIADRLAALAMPGALARTVLATAARKRGTTNALIDWNAFDAAWIGAALGAIPPTIWGAMFDFMLDNLEQTRTGFPDLTLFGVGRPYRFVEVKGPGDQLRREQRLWFAFFADHQVPATVLRVEW
jgi:hypothetical protein